MELVTKILSSNFFAIFTDMLKIANNWNYNGEPREKLDFNNFVKKRLLLLSKFQFKPIKNFNLSLCLRLQFLLQYHLVACLDEKSQQVYSQYLCKENKKLIFSILQNEGNFKVIIRELYKGNYAYLDFLIEIFYALKNNVDSFIKIQSLLNNLGLMDLLSSLISQFEFKHIDGTIFLEVKNQYFNTKKHFLSFLELIMFFIYKNKNCFILKMFPKSSSIKKSDLLQFIFTLPFQNTFEKSNVFVLRILEIVVSNMNELVDDPMPYQQCFASVFCDVVENYNLYNHRYFFLILEMLMNNKEYNTLRTVMERADIWTSILENMCFQSKKPLCTTIVKISSCLMNQLNIWPTNKQLNVLIDKWLKYLNKNKYNILTSCVYGAIQETHNKSAHTLEKLLSPSILLSLKGFVTTEVSTF